MNTDSRYCISYAIQATPAFHMEYIFSIGAMGCELILQAAIK